MTYPSRARRLADQSIVAENELAPKTPKVAPGTGGQQEVPGTLTLVEAFTLVVEVFLPQVTSASQPMINGLCTMKFCPASNPKTPPLG